MVIAAKVRLCLSADSSIGINIPSGDWKRPRACSRERNIHERGASPRVAVARGFLNPAIRDLDAAIYRLSIPPRYCAPLNGDERGTGWISARNLFRDFARASRQTSKLQRAEGKESRRGEELRAEYLRLGERKVAEIIRHVGPIGSECFSV